MVKSKKLLSLFLAVVMVLSVFSVMAAAYTVGDAEGSADIDIKYTVEKVDTVPETEAGSAEWSADNIYAVTAWMKSSKGVDILTVPFHYNKALFSPIMLSDGECTYPYGAGLDQDTYYSDMGEGAVYAYSLGDYMNNTGMYKADGSNATTKALAKAIGLGNSNSAGIKIQTELVSPDHPVYSKWGAGLPANTGVLFANINVAQSAKTVYFNTIEGIAINTDWNRMFTLYFETITDADVTGAEFGVFTDDCYTVDGNYDGTGSGYYVGGSSYQAIVPSMNIVSNAVVEAAAAPELSISWFKNQIRFDADKDGLYANQFDYRIVAQFDNFEEIFDDDADAVAKIKDVGFIFCNESTTVWDVNAAKAQVESIQIDDAGKVTFGTRTYSAAVDCYVSKSFSGTDYAFACYVPDIEDNDTNRAATLHALGYVVYEDANGEQAYAYFDYDLSISKLYSENSAYIPD